MTIEILFQDDHILVVDKPEGLLSVPGRGPQAADSLITRVRETLPEARTVHRLDCETSGVSVIALGAEAHRALNRRFHDREVDKTYLAVCSGRLKPERGEIDYPMSSDYANRPRQQIDYFYGKDALTRWQVLDYQKDRTRVKLAPVTGRSHQLRLHLCALGHPILGDSLYAPPDLIAAAPRLLLHAHTLAFTHPVTLKPMTFQATCPF
ncbi:MAG: pseudouridine synthase [Acidobacteriota bacterium]|nr:pseudouridine synthase [Acidobacteriota bacterium]